MILDHEIIGHGDDFPTIGFVNKFSLEFVKPLVADRQEGRWQKAKGRYKIRSRISAGGNYKCSAQRLYPLPKLCGILIAEKSYSKENFSGLFMARK